MSTKYTAIYLRVSTVGQDHASQMPELERWADQHDGPLTRDAGESGDEPHRGGSRVKGGTVKWYRDKFTGKTMDRPGMNGLLDDLRAGRLERIVVWRLDRLGRTARGLCELFDELGERKVDLVSLRDGFSLNTPSGRLHARILASVAEFETEIRAERVRAGQAAARAKGKRWGGSKPGRMLKVTADQVQAITRMVAAGEKITKVARITGLSRQTIYRILRNHAAA